MSPSYARPILSSCPASTTTARSASWKITNRHNLAPAYQSIQSWDPGTISFEGCTTEPTAPQRRFNNPLLTHPWPPVMTRTAISQAHTGHTSASRLARFGSLWRRPLLTCLPGHHPKCLCHLLYYLATTGLFLTTYISSPSRPLKLRCRGELLTVRGTPAAPGAEGNSQPCGVRALVVGNSGPEDLAGQLGGAAAYFAMVMYTQMVTTMARSMGYNGDLLGGVLVDGGDLHPKVRVARTVWGRHGSKFWGPTCPSLPTAWQGETIAKCLKILLAKIG